LVGIANFEPGSGPHKPKKSNNFSSIISRIIHTSASDHKLVVITLGTLGKLGPNPFRYTPIWNNSEEVKKITAEVWSQKIIGSPNFVSETKLKTLRKEMKICAKNNHKEMQKRKAKLIKKMEIAQETKE